MTAHPQPTAREAVFKQLSAAIITGQYPPGSRLPAERALAISLGASRPTLREALRRLSDWGLVESRRGSGVVVRDRSEWSIDVLPTVLQRQAFETPRQAVETVRDLLTVRRPMMTEILRLTAGRIDAEGVARARRAVARAWAARHTTSDFTVEDFQAVRTIATAANFLPALWFLNAVQGVYLELARLMAGSIPPPEEYASTLERVLDHIEEGDGEAASNVMDRYLKQHDEQLLEVLESKLC